MSEQKLREQMTEIRERKKLSFCDIWFSFVTSNNFDYIKAYMEKGVDFKLGPFKGLPVL
jgi:hypothetical protein